MNFVSALKSLETAALGIVDAADSTSSAAISASLDGIENRVAAFDNRPLDTLRQFAEARQVLVSREQDLFARSMTEKLRSCEVASAKMLAAQRKVFTANQDVQRASQAASRQLALLDARLYAQVQTVQDVAAGTSQVTGDLTRQRQTVLWILTAVAVVFAVGAGFATYRSLCVRSVTR